MFCIFNVLHINTSSFSKIPDGRKRVVVAGVDTVCCLDGVRCAWRVSVPAGAGVLQQSAGEVCAMYTLSWSPGGCSALLCVPGCCLCSGDSLHPNLVKAQWTPSPHHPLHTHHPAKPNKRGTWSWKTDSKAFEW